MSPSGAGTPSPSLFRGHGRGPSHDGGPAPGCAPGSSPRAGPGCGTCGAGSSLWSGCGRVLWTALA